MDLAALESSIDALGESNAAFAYEISTILKGPFRRLSIEVQSNSYSPELKSIFAENLARSGLGGLVRELSERLGRQFDTTDVEEAVRAVDRFWQVFYATDQRREIITAVSQPNAPVETRSYVDALQHPQALEKFARILTQCLLSLPTSIDEWRRDRFLTRVSEMLELASGTLAISTKSGPAQEEVLRTLSGRDCVLIVERAEVLRKIPSDPSLLQDDLVAVTLLYLSVLSVLTRVESKLMKSNFD